MTENKKVYRSEFNIVCFVMFSLLQKGHGWDLLLRMKVPCSGSGVSPLEFVLSFFFLFFFNLLEILIKYDFFMESHKEPNIEGSEL